MNQKKEKHLIQSASPSITHRRNPFRRRKKVQILTVLFLVALTVTSCSQEDRKPELNPVILTSAPNATNLRPYTIPEGMTSYMDLEAMREALNTSDVQLEGVDEVFILSPEPLDLSPSFRAQHGEVRTIYKNRSNDRSFHIYQYPSLDPHLLFDEKKLVYDKEEIQGESFYIVDQLIQRENHEAYAIRHGWLIQLTAMGMTHEEFMDTLADLTSESLE